MKHLIYSTQRVQLYCADWRDLELHHSIDAVVSDPPYGINVGAMVGGNRDRLFKRGPSYDYHIVGDDNPFDPAPLLHFPRLILWGGNHFASRLPDSRCWLVWDKRCGTTSDNQGDCEMAWTNLPGPTRLYSQLWRGMMRSGEENLSYGKRRVHPAQKPVALMTWCLAQLKLPAPATIFDPYMGSGSTGVAAVRAGYNFIGVEIESHYAAIAADRIVAEERQARLIA